jgi:hypothetical protein
LDTSFANVPPEIRELRVRADAGFGFNPVFVALGARHPSGPAVTPCQPDSRAPARRLGHLLTLLRRPRSRLAGPAPVRCRRTPLLQECRAAPSSCRSGSPPRGYTRRTRSRGRARTAGRSRRARQAPVHERGGPGGAPSRLHASAAVGRGSPARRQCGGCAHCRGFENAAPSSPRSVLRRRAVGHGDALRRRRGGAVRAVRAAARGRAVVGIDFAGNQT